MKFQIYICVYNPLKITHSNQYRNIQELCIYLYEDENQKMMSSKSLSGVRKVMKTLKQEVPARTFKLNVIHDYLFQYGLLQIQTPAYGQNIPMINIFIQKKKV